MTTRDKYTYRGTNSTECRSSNTPNYNTCADHPANALAGDKETTQVKWTTKDGGDSHGCADQNLPPPPIKPSDLSTTIPGMYRILDLISEQGSGGLGKSIPTLPETQVD